MPMTVIVSIVNQTPNLAVFVRKVTVHYGTKRRSRAFLLVPSTEIKLEPKQTRNWKVPFDPDETVIVQQYLTKEAQPSFSDQPGIESPAQLFNAIGMGDKRHSWVEVDFNEYESRVYLKGKVKPMFDFVGKHMESKREDSKEAREIFELSEKINYLALRSRAALRLVTEIEVDDYEKRILGRAVFQAVYSFLDLAPRLQNRFFETGTFDKQQRLSTKGKIASLRTFYQSEIEKVRHFLTAHRQPLDFGEAFEFWNSITESAVQKADSMLSEIAEELLKVRGGVRWSLVQTPDVTDFAKSLKSDKGAAAFASDSLAITRSNTSGLIPSHPDQEKAARVASICHMYRRLIRFVHFAGTSDANGLTQHVLWLLFLLNGSSLLENLYENRLEEGVEDDSLLKRWKNNPTPYKGLPVIEQAHRERDLALEKTIKDVRNHFAAHLDNELSLEAIIREFEALDHRRVAEYLYQHGYLFFEACRGDIRTKIFLIDDHAVEGAVGLAQDSTVPFKNPPEE